MEWNATPSAGKAQTDRTGGHSEAYSDAWGQPGKLLPAEKVESGLRALLETS